MKKWTAAMGGAILSCSLQAQAITKPCDGCSADQMYEMAFDSLSEMRIHGPLYVADLRRGMCGNTSTVTTSDRAGALEMKWRNGRKKPLLNPTFLRAFPRSED